MSYAQTSDLSNAYRNSLLCNLVTDGNSPSPLTITGNPVAQAALDAAAGMINSAALEAERYTVADLQALTGVDLAYLVNLNCVLAYWLLLKRVGQGNPPPAEAVQAFEDLERLKKGERVFNVAADVAASQATINFPSCQTYATVNDLRTYAGRAFPVRQQQRVAPS